jgi:hypothetical protein
MFFSSSIIMKGEKIMKKSLLVLVLLPLLIVSLGGVSQAGQGRMGGMGDPYGLLMDESDFLIHPAKIANGEGVRFYGYYRFTYTDVMNWDYELDLVTPPFVFYDFDTSGQEYSHDAQVGAAFPLGPGRMGLFFSYNGERGDYSGDEYGWDDMVGIYANFDYDLNSARDDFALMLLYGLPVGGFNLGGEVQFAYRQAENKEWFQRTDLSYGALNYPAGNFLYNLNLFPFMFPYDSNYWEALLKGSLEGDVGPLDCEFTLRGGFIFGGDNGYEYEYQSPVGTYVGSYDLDGSVGGWRIGGDLWMRYPVDSLTLPFLVRVDYQERTRDGDGAGSGSHAGSFFEYESTERNLEIEVGGGVDKALNEGLRIGAGIYYGYLQGAYDIMTSYLNNRGLLTVWDFSKYPFHTEHRVRVLFSGDWELTPTVALRMGLQPFYGWVREDFADTYSTSTPTYTDKDISLNGYHWGIGGSLGGSVQFDSFTMEPFFNVGWQQFDLDGDGETTGTGGTAPWGMDLSRSEWYIGGGCSFLFNIP